MNKQWLFTITFTIFLLKNSIIAQCIPMNICGYVKISFKDIEKDYAEEHKYDIAKYELIKSQDLYLKYKYTNKELFLFKKYQFGLRKIETTALNFSFKKYKNRM